MIEIKCPTATTHLKTMLSQTCEHQAQIQGYLWITGRKWCDYVSFNPELTNAGLAVYVQRIERDEEYITDLADKVLAFHASAESLVDDLRKLASPVEEEQSAMDRLNANIEMYVNTP
jgi:exodeoxyribonuclease (lambda-induced)